MKWKRLLAAGAISFTALTANVAVSTVPAANASSLVQHQELADGSSGGTTSGTTSGGTGGNQTSGIPGMPTPSFTGDSPDAGFKTTTDVGTYLGAKFKLGLTILFGIATIVIVILGVWKGMRLSGSNSRNRSEAQHELLWWAIGGGFTFAAALISGLLYAFSTTTS